MSKPNKVQYSDVGVFANGYLLSRVQSFSWELDQGEEEARELTNAEVVEYSAQNPQVSVSIETNEYGSCRNLRAIAQITGGGAADIINIDSFDGTTADIGVQFEEDGVLARTAIMNDCFVGSLSWSFDVSGPATESISLETDKLTFYKGADGSDSYKRAFSLMGFTSSVTNDGEDWAVAVPLITGLGGVDNTEKYKPFRVYVDGVLATGIPAFTTGYLADNLSDEGLVVTFTDSNFTATGSRYRVVILKTGDSSTVIDQSTSTSANAIGSIPRGKLNIYLTTGADVGGDLDALTATNLLRVQSLSADVDFNREILYQLGFYAAYDRSLSKPVPVTISISMLDSDLEEWAKFCDVANATTVTTLDITDFVKTAQLRVEIYDKVNTDSSRSMLKSLTFSGLQITAVSESIDAGSNGTMDYSLKCSNFVLSGDGTPGEFPLDASPST